MQVVSSRTTMPPEPIIAPVFGMFSKSTGVSPSDAGMQPPDGPPIWTALNVRPPLMPPPIPMTRSLMDIPMGTSASPPRATLPASAKTFVPLLFSVPIAAYAAAPFVIIHGTLAYVSTLLLFVGFCQRPFSAGKGGLILGMPRSPSMDANRAVSSPQTKAPAPCLILMSKLSPEPRMSPPR